MYQLIKDRIKAITVINVPGVHSFIHSSFHSLIQLNSYCMVTDPRPEDAVVNKKDKTLALTGFHFTWNGR